MGHLRVRRILLGAVFVLFCITQSQAATFGDVRGIVFDPQHHAIAGATLLSITAVNVANRRFLLDNSNTFGGTHFVEPRQIYVEVRYRLHY